VYVKKKDVTSCERGYVKGNVGSKTIYQHMIQNNLFLTATAQIKKSVFEPCIPFERQ